GGRFDAERCRWRLAGADRTLRAGGRTEQELNRFAAATLKITTVSKEIIMSEFIVHSIPGSPFGRAVLTTLEEKGASWRLSPVAPGTFRSPEHLARHPFGRVPVLEHNGFSLYETQAILRYLDRVLPAPALTPADPKRIARMDQV